ncbi:Cytochrome P450 monooxygenase [Rhizoctonia solani]|uniref:Cytochrome P450 monooxygenase n=1 Tax=Rhizoctonia solani TaxID=456999 RepID=A0A8H7LZW3_9AGAM|nr:Cytochrome P450 monooxygenase [Rhizoctonia solani]
MYTEQVQLTGSQYFITAATLLIAYYFVPYLRDPYGYRGRFSGPLAASFSNWWLARSTQSGHHSENIHELHEKYGKFVRIGPNHISIADPNALEGVYGHSSGVLKSEFYEAFRIGRQDDVFTTQKKASHTTKRKRIANIFSAQNVQAFEPRVRTHVERLCAQLDLRCEQAMKGISGFNWEARGGQAVINMCPQFSYLAFDIISDLSLGIPFGLIEAQKDSIPRALSLVSEKKVQDLPVIRLIAQGSTSSTILGSHSPLLQKVLFYCAPWYIPDSVARRNMLHVTRAAVNTRVSRTENGTAAAEGDGGSENRGVDLLDKLFEVKNTDGSPLSREEIDSEALVTIGAGSDTTSNSLSALCYHVASDARIKQKLQEELDSAFASTQKDVNDFASFEEIKNLPYLNACIKEALRLHSTVGIGLPRVVPTGKTLTVAGETFKEGSVISVPSYTTNRSNVWGSDAEMYRPERWLEDGSESLNKYYFAFSTGPRACIGRNLAHMDMMLSSAAFFRRYDVDLATPTTKLEIKEGFVRETVRCEVAIKRRI